MEPYIFFLDIDGTLAAGGKVPEENVRAIIKAQEKGHYVVINTGRSYAHISDGIINAAPYDGIVCGLGTDIRIHEEQIFSQPLSQGILGKIVKAFREAKDIFVIFEGEDALYYMGDFYVPENGIKVSYAEDWEEKYPNAKISKFTHSTIQEEPLKFLYDVLTPYHHPTYSEYGQKGCTKAKGMEIVANKLGVPIEQCVAIGDSANDIEMLTSAGIAVAMGNATEDVKELADFVTGNAWDAGVAEAIYKLICP